jgi:hypothetical protein
LLVGLGLALAGVPFVTILVALVVRPRGGARSGRRSCSYPATIWV